MGSITGFNSSVTGAFSAGDPISASKLNRLASGVELTKTQFSDGLIYQGGPSGVPYTVQYPTPFSIEGAPEQFQVKMDGNKMYIAKGRVICRSSPNTFNGGCLREYDITASAIWPNDSFVEGFDADSPWIDDGGYIEILPPETFIQYGVYLVLNQYKVGGGSLEAGAPYLAIMPLSGDAWNKTKPWGGEDGCDLQRWFEFYTYKNVNLLQPPIDPTYEVSGQLTQGRESKLQNYNCQRVPIALISWDSTESKWLLKQYAIGTLTIPYNIFYSGVYPFPIEDPPLEYPTWYTTPLYDSQQEDWEGTFTDCEKWDGTLPSPTTSIPV